MGDGPGLFLLEGLDGEGEWESLAPIDISMLLYVSNMHVARLTGMVILDSLLIYFH